MATLKAKRHRQAVTQKEPENEDTDGRTDQESKTQSEEGIQGEGKQNDEHLGSLAWLIPRGVDAEIEAAKERRAG